MLSSFMMYVFVLCQHIYNYIYTYIFLFHFHECPPLHDVKHVRFPCTKFAAKKREAGLLAELHPDLPGN